MGMVYGRSENDNHIWLYTDHEYDMFIDIGHEKLVINGNSCHGKTSNSADLKDIQNIEYMDDPKRGDIQHVLITFTDGTRVEYKDHVISKKHPNHNNTFGGVDPMSTINYILGLQYGRKTKTV